MNGFTAQVTDEIHRAQRDLVEALSYAAGPIGAVAGAVGLADRASRGELTALDALSFVPAARMGKVFSKACFVAGTLVQTQDGPKPIEDIRIGDMVWSRPELDGEAGYRKVINAFAPGERYIWEVEVTTADGRCETFRATDDHPFWVEFSGEDEATGGWTGVALLNVGDQLRLADGSSAYVSRVEDTGEVEAVFNMEVDGWHTYHIGELGVWVHNTNCRENYILGKAREALVRIDLKKMYPGAEVLGQRMLRGSNQKKLVDKVTGEGRVLDFVVVKDGVALDVVEVTGKYVNKTAQLEKEMRIHQLGDVFVRAPGSKTLIDITGRISRVVRKW